MQTACNIGTYLGKQAATIGKPGAVTTAVTDTAGQVGSTLGLIAPLLLGMENYQSPRKKGRREQHEEAVKELSEARPDALEGTRVRLGGPNLVDDMLWKFEDEGEDLPWYKQLGGRVLQNKRTGPLGKLLGYPSVLPIAITSALTRSPHYNPFTDAVNQPVNNRSVTEHELGHAIDFNSLSGPEGKVPSGWLGRQLAGTKRDLYAMLGSMPFLQLYLESEANRESEDAIADALPKDKFQKRVVERSKVLPGAFGAYVGTDLGAVVGLPNPVVGALVGMALGRNKKRLSSESERAADKWESRKAKSTEKTDKQTAKADKKDGRAGRDADGDGKFNEGQRKAAALGLAPNMDLALLGGLVGGGAGLATYAGKRLTADDDDDESARPSIANHLLLGSALGAGVGYNFGPGVRDYLQREEVLRAIRNRLNRIDRTISFQKSSSIKEAAVPPEVLLGALLGGGGGLATYAGRSMMRDEGDPEPSLLPHLLLGGALGAGTGYGVSKLRHHSRTRNFRRYADAMRYRLEQLEEQRKRLGAVEKASSSKEAAIPPEVLLGALLGGGGGLATYAGSSLMRGDDEERPSLPAHLLLGALLGAGAGGLYRGAAGSGGAPKGGEPTPSGDVTPNKPGAVTKTAPEAPPLKNNPAYKQSPGGQKPGAAPTTRVTKPVPGAIDRRPSNIGPPSGIDMQPSVPKVPASLDKIV